MKEGMRLTNAWRKVRCSEDVSDILRTVNLGQGKLDKNKENLWVLCLDTHHRVFAVHLVAIGTLDETLVHPREVFRPPVLEGAAKIIVVHNHPTGDPRPSKDDEHLTERLVAAGSILGIVLLDHVIIADNGKFDSVMKGDK